MPLVSESYGNTISVEGPKLLDQPVLEFLCPFALEECGDLRSSGQELRTVPPSRVQSIGLGHCLSRTRIPGILRQANFQDRTFTCEWRQGRTHRSDCRLRA